MTITPVLMNIRVHRNEYSRVSPEMHRYLSNQRAITSLESFHYGNLGLVTHSGVIVKLPSNRG